LKIRPYHGSLVRSAQEIPANMVARGLDLAFAGSTCNPTQDMRDTLMITY
jgi:hypothetical protein